MCFRILFFLSLYQNDISRYQTIIIKHTNKNYVDLIKFSISSLEIYKPRLEIYIFKLKIEFVFQQINFLSAYYQLFYDSFTETNPEIGDTMTKT